MSETSAPAAYDIAFSRFGDNFMGGRLVAHLQRLERYHLKLALTSQDPVVGGAHYRLANRCREGLDILSKGGAESCVWDDIAPAWGLCRGSTLKEHVRHVPGFRRPAVPRICTSGK